MTLPNLPTPLPHAAASAPLEPAAPAMGTVCPSPARIRESWVWAAVMEIDTAVSLGRRYATRPAPSPLEAYDLVGALACAAHALATLTAQAAQDVAHLAAMQGHAGGPTGLAAAALDQAAALARCLTTVYTETAGDMAPRAGVPSWPSHEVRPVVPARRSRVVAVVMDRTW